jgi:hypothetical protein
MYTLPVLLFFWGILAAPAQAPDALTELDLVLKENVRLQKELVRVYELNDACRMQLAPVIKAKNDAAVAKAEAELKARIEAAHPGHTYDVKGGTLERQPTPKN